MDQQTVRRTHPPPRSHGYWAEGVFSWAWKVLETPGADEPPTTKTSALEARLSAAYPLTQGRTDKDVITSAITFVGGKATVADAKAIWRPRHNARM